MFQIIISNLAKIIVIEVMLYLSKLSLYRTKFHKNEQIFFIQHKKIVENKIKRIGERRERVRSKFMPIKLRLTIYKY